MTLTRNTWIIALALAATSLIAGCQSRSTTPAVAITPTPNPETQPQVSALEGKWIPRDPAARAIYYNEFRKGKFGAYAADGSSTLALGSYTPTENGATLKYFSEAQKREVRATCVKATDVSMTCTTDSGSVAELVRA